jgi:hypothetical protein
MAIENNPAGTKEAPAAEDGGGHRWYHKIGALIYVFFCFELGIFLLLFPWLDLWQQNLLGSLTPGWYELWNSPYVKGAISGLGVIDIGISFSELFRLRRFAKDQSPDPLQ